MRTTNVFTATIDRLTSRNQADTALPRRSMLRRLLPLFTPLAVLAVWQVVTMLEIVPAFIIPPPVLVGEKFIAVIADGRLWLHTGTTVQEVVIGLAFGVSVGLVLGYLIARVPVLEEILSPLIVAFQATPVLAYAPLLVVWFGTGLNAKIVTSALVVFFPMLMNTIVGIRGVPQDLRDLMRVSRASRWQTFSKLEMPAAMPVLLTGLKTSATLAVIGAVVGEFVAANAGLGFWVKLARDQYDTPLVFVAVLTLTLMALSMYGLISVVERRMLGWRRRARRDS